MADNVADAMRIAEQDLLRDMERMKNLSARDRDMILTTFRVHAERVVAAYVKPLVERQFSEASTHNALREATLNTLAAANLPQRVDRVTGKIDDLVGDVSGVKTALASITERLNHVPTKAEMYIAGGAAFAALLGVLARGFGWL